MLPVWDTSPRGAKRARCTPSGDSISTGLYVPWCFLALKSERMLLFHLVLGGCGGELSALGSARHRQHEHGCQASELSAAC